MRLKKILLASKSPRRSQLLKEMGIAYEVVSIDVEESYPPHLAEEEIATFIAVKKAKAYTETVPSDAVLVTADSIVVLDGQVYGKPRDKSDAMHTLRKLSARKHSVYTGVCLKTNDQTVVFYEKSEIEFYPLTDEEIEYYLDAFQPYDKAGSYGIQDWIGLCKVATIEGSYSNIMGLPTSRLYNELNKL